jgi:hypothetical protein
MLVSMVLHELGHAAAMLVAGVESIRVRTSFVTGDVSSLSVAAQAGIVAAGPAVSALLAVGAAVVQRRAGRRISPIAVIALVWTEVLAAAYLFVAVALAPFGSRDTARLLALVSAPGWIAAALVPVGIALLLFVAGPRRARLAARAVPGQERWLVVSGWSAVLVTQAIVLRSVEWIAVAFMALCAIPTLQSPQPGSQHADLG